MELAVNMPAQEPQPGQAHSASSFRSSSQMAPAFTAPTPSKTVIRSTSLPLIAAGQHGAAADEDGRDVEPQGRHEHARDDLVAVGHQDQAVKRVGHGHDLDGVGDELPGGQGIFHALVVHGHAVADADDPELQGGAAGHAHPGLGGLGDLVQVDVAGDEFVKGIGHPDDGLVDLPVGEPHGLEEGAVGVFFQALFHQVAAHGRLLKGISTRFPGGSH